jgi:hypothetical protein
VTLQVLVEFKTVFKTDAGLEINVSKMRKKFMALGGNV